MKTKAWKEQPKKECALYRLFDTHSGVVLSEVDENGKELSQILWIDDNQKMHITQEKGLIEIPYYDRSNIEVKK